MLSQIPLTDILLILYSGFFLLLISVFAYYSFNEQEVRAGLLSLLIGFVVLALCASIFLWASPLMKKGIILIPWLMLLVFLPFKRITPEVNQTPATRIDERDTMLSRRLLQENSPEYKAYYTDHPDRKKMDDAIRARPGFLSPESQLYHPYSFSAAKAGFETIMGLVEYIDGPVRNTPVSFSGEEVTRFIKLWVLKMGVVNVGITHLMDYHLYSYRGRRHNYGREVKQEHKYAIAFSVEMDKEMMDTAPKGPTIMESARKYLDAAHIAIQVAQWIRGMGYPARAHIDANYEVICPLVARDAGLGDIGRMGLLMTPNLGPRIRIGVVTTNLEMVADQFNPDPAMIDFCTRCRKCAEVCPGQAIPFQNRKQIDGVLRWQINQEKCYEYWCISGTDCGRCMAVCPYSHPDNFLHNLVRQGIRNSFLFRRFALPLDHIFYGRKPRSKPIPEWMGEQ